MPTLTYPHWRDVPANAWRWPNFSAAEIACRGTGAIKINTEAMDKLQALRDRLGKPLIVRSALSQPGTQPRRWRGPGLEAHAGDRLRHRHVEPQSGRIR